MYKLQRPLGARARSAISAKRRMEKKRLNKLFLKKSAGKEKCEHVRGGDSSGGLVEAAFLPVLNHSVAVGREAGAVIFQGKKEGK
jgi:hypothetical protein